MLLDLQVGARHRGVQVTARRRSIDTTRSDLGGVVTSSDIANLPTLNRTFANLAMTMPEARPAGDFDPTKTRVGNFAMNGGDGRQLDVNVDGGDNKDNVVGSLLQNFAYESIQEFQVLQHRWTRGERPRGRRRRERDQQVGHERPAGIRLRSRSATTA